MSTSALVAGTPFPAKGTARRKERVAHPDDIYDLALAGARFVLDLEAQKEQHGHAHGSERARGEIRSTLHSLSARRTLRGLSPVWSQAASSLIRQEQITASELDEALADRVAGESLGQLLLRRTAVPEGLVAETIARATTAPVIQLTTYPVHGEPFRSAEDALAAPKHPVLVDELAARTIPRELQKRHDMILVAAWEHEGVLAMVDPGDEEAVWEAQEATGLRLVRFTALASQLRLAIERCWQPRADVDVPATGTSRDALPFATAVGVPALVLVAIFLFVFRDALNLRHHFALAALACGIFFFSYALRYYITTAAVVGTVLFGDRLRRQRIVSQIRAMKHGDATAVAPSGNGTGAHASGDGAQLHGNGTNGNGTNGNGTNGNGKRHDYRTLRGERLDDIGAIVTAGPEKIGAHRLPREKQPFVSIHLAMYNERQVVDRLLRACTSFDYDNYEVIVADDSTDANALAILDRWKEHPRIRILHRSTRKGFKGGALQEALRRMDERTEYVMIFDADFIPPPDAIWHFLDYFGRLPGPRGENGYGYHQGDLTGIAGGIPTNGDRLAAVQGYQWHMLNASENWITKGIRTEFSGSYVLERAAQELFGTMKMISGSVYMIRADVLRRLGWSTSITEDWELTIRLYLAGYKVLYTPYIQAPSECVSRIKELVRQRMRWARGHTFNVKKYFFAVLRSPNMSWREKLEFLYYAPYYLQSILFLGGTVSWVLGIFLLGQKLPQWGEVLGWSLVLSNVLALPLMNLAGLVLEGSVRRDIVGLGSFIGLSTLLVPFQGWAALRGLLEPTEGGWDRTPKSGRITEAIGALRLGKLFPWELPRRRKKPSSRVAHIVVTCIAGVLAGAIVAVGALSMRAAASSGKVAQGDLVAPFVFGTLLPLGVVAYGWFKLHRRIAVCVLAAAIGLSSNVVFLAATIPANAVAGTSSTFMFRNATVFDAPNFDMEQGYTPAGAATQTPASLGNNWTAIFGSDVFPPTASMSAGSATVDLYGENNVATISFVAAGTYASAASGNVTPFLPTGWAQNDLFILVLQTNDNVVSTMPAGWLNLFAVNNGTSSRASVFYKIGAASESAATVTHTSGNSISAQILAFRGVDTTTPIESWGQQASAADLNTEAPGSSTTVPNTMLVFTAHVADNWNGLSWPAGWTESFFNSTAFGTDSAIGAAYMSAPSAGTQAAVTASRTTGGAAAVSNGAQIALRPATRSCTITATLKHVSGTTTTLGSGTGTFTSPGSTSGTLVQITFSTTAVTFADGDRLRLEVSAPLDATNCNARLHFDGVSQQSKLVTATIVPEGLLGLLLIAPVLPIAIRKRWIRIPTFGRRDRRERSAR